MESIKNKWNNLSLRQYFIMTVFLSFGIVVVLSALIIGGCVSFRHWLLPDSNAVYLTIEETLSDGSVVNGIHLMEYGQDLTSLPILFEDGENTVQEKREEARYSLQKIENSADSLTPKRKLAYRVCGITIFAAPTILAFAAIFICSMVFYRRKLKEPLKILADAAEQIASENLDFEIEYNCRDEMGDLCRSFENMRAALCENNKAMWNMLEERRLMQASVAHDLRNPIAIIEGYTEYLDKSLHNGEMNMEKTARIVNNLGVAAKRLERYTESVRLLNQSEETQLNKKPVSVLNLAESITEDLSLVTEHSGIKLNVTKNLPDEEIQIDSMLLYRVLENIINNALRYADSNIYLDFSLADGIFTVNVTDDGEGFSEDILNKNSKKLLIAGEDGHMGIGLSISRLLCQKHGGSMELSNTGSGACVKISLLI